MTQIRTCLDCGFLTIQGRELSRPDRIMLGTHGTSAVMPADPEQTRCYKSLWDNDLHYSGDTFDGVIEEIERSRNECPGFALYDPGLTPVQHLEIQLEQRKRGQRPAEAVNDLPSKFAALLAKEKRRFDRSLGEDLRELRADYGSGSNTALLMQNRYEVDIEERLSALLATLKRLLATSPNSEIRDDKPELARLAHVWLQAHIEDCQGNLNEHALRIGPVSPGQYDLGRNRFLDALAVELDLLNTSAPSVAVGTEMFVDPVRIAELSSMPPAKFDVSRLVRLCQELNLCFSHRCFYAVAFLTRAILDHIPPIFGFKTFREVASNYNGGKSFREVTSHLDGVSRKISDAFLHVPMRDREILPTLTQVDVRQQLDTVLGEVVRIGQRKA